MDVEDQADAATQAVEELEDIVQNLSKKRSSESPGRGRAAALRARRAVAAYELEVRALRENDNLKHVSLLQELRDRVTLCQSRMDELVNQSTHDLQAADLSGVAQPHANMSLDQVKSTATGFQDASKESLRRTKNLALRSEEVGVATLGKMQEQDEQLERIDADLKKTKTTLGKSKKLVRRLSLGSLNLKALLPLSSESQRCAKPRSRSSVRSGDLANLAVAGASRSESRGSFRSGLNEEPRMSAFQKTKLHLQQMLEQLNTAIQDGRASPRNPSEHEGLAIQAKLDELERSFSMLQGIHRQARPVRDGKASQDEYQAGYQEIRSLRKQIDDVAHAFSVAQSHGSHVHLHGDVGRALSDEEQRTLDSMRQRDVELDTDLKAIGQVVERMGDVARQIGVSAERQKDHAATLVTHCESSQQDVRNLNKRIGKMLR